jgi:copper chaperone CopZ
MRALEGLPGVTRAQVNLEGERATVDYDPHALTIARMVGAIQGTVILPGVRRAMARTARARRGQRTR